MLRNIEIYGGLRLVYMTLRKLRDEGWGEIASGEVAASRRRWSRALAEYLLPNFQNLTIIEQPLLQNSLSAPR
jgi:hypothetical protein